MEKKDDKKYWLSLLLSLGITMAGGFTSYFNAIGEIKKDNQAMREADRKEYEDKFATKEETKFIQQNLNEIKEAIKDGNQSIYQEIREIKKALKKL